MVTSGRTTPLQKRQILTFCLAWLAYASTYFLRKPLGVIKEDLQFHFLFTDTELGLLDAALLLPYATMQMLLGPLGDKLGTRKAFSICLILSGLSMISFGEFSSLKVFCLLLFLNGTAQALTWPSAVKAVGSWYPTQSRNSIMGVFGTNAFVGGIVGTAFAVYLQHYYSWRSVYFLPSCFVIIMGVFVRYLLYSPEELNIAIPGRQTVEIEGIQVIQEQPRWLDLWKIPCVPELAFTMFCLKVVRYCMYMWLPLYLSSSLLYSTTQAGMFSTVFEIGGVLGSVSIGFIVDHYFKGQPIAGPAISAFASTLALAAFFVTGHWGPTFNMAFLALAGMFNCGPDTILGASVPMELGEANGRAAGTAVIGLVNGFGSVGTFLEGPILGYVIETYKWDGMAVILVVLSMLGTLMCFRASHVFNRKPKSAADLLPLIE